MNATPPYLTLVLTGRNDDFGGDFNNRFIRALRFNHQHLNAAGVPHEFVFVEWRPIERQPYLATVLGSALSDLGSLQLRSFIVDPSAARITSPSRISRPTLSWPMISGPLGARRTTWPFC